MFFFNLFIALIAAVVVLLFELLQTQTIESPYLAMMGFLIVFSVATIDLEILKKLKTDPAKRFWLYGLSYIGGAISYLTFFPLFSFVLTIKWEFQDYRLLSILILSSVILNTAILLIQSFLLLQQEKNLTEIEVSQLRSAHAEASNYLLRQQIHPHFLFNSLSNLKALYKEDPEAGEIYIVHLANFLRISISNQRKKLCTLKDEINFLKDYLKMQKIRFGDGLVYNINIIDDSLYQLYIPPISLQLLAENAIKHNDFTNEMPLLIEISTNGENITVSNNIQKKRNPEMSSGFGLANLQERYELISGDSITIKKSEKRFSVTLKLLRNEYTNN